MSLKQQIVADLTASMKAKEVERTSTLRMVKAAVMNREIEKGTELTDEELSKILKSLVKQRRDSIEQFEKAGRMELAAKERLEIEVIEGYLPKAASREEIETTVNQVLSEMGAPTMKEMGAVMKAVQARLGDQNADGRTVSEIVKKRLAE